MKTTAIVIDTWKLTIFQQALTEAGYEFTKHKGVTPDTLTLKVKTDQIAKLQPIVDKANKQGSSSGRRTGMSTEPNNDVPLINEVLSKDDSHMLFSQLLLALVKKNGGQLDVSVADVDATGDSIMTMEMVGGGGGQKFRLKTSKKQ